MGRDTRTGGVLEAMIVPALTHGGYVYRMGVDIGTRLGGGRHKIDVLAQKGESQILVSLKWQQTPGTAEQKIPFEVICLMEAVQTSNGEYKRAYLVLGGGGWKLRNFYISGGLSNYLKYDEAVKILNLEAFVAKANRGEL